MDIVFSIWIGLLSAITLLIVMGRLGLRKFMGYPAIVDVLATTFLAMLLHGTYAGMAAAVVGGLFLSLAITVIRKTYGYATFSWSGWIYHEGVYYTQLKSMCNQVKGVLNG